MTSISVEGVRGGIGTSTLTWAIARELENCKLFDYSSHQGIGWVTGGFEIDFNWPEYVSKEVSTRDLFSKMNVVENVAVFSGGFPYQLSEEIISSHDGNLVFDGRAETQFRIKHTTNSFADIKALEKKSDFDLLVMRKVRGGIPQSILPELKIDFIYKSESNVHRTISNGYGLHRKTKVQLVAKEICARLSDISSINN